MKRIVVCLEKEAGTGHEEFTQYTILQEEKFPSPNALMGSIRFTSLLDRLQADERIVIETVEE